MDEIVLQICGFAKPNNSWLGRQFVDRTFEDEVEVDVAAIRGLLDEAKVLQDESK